MADKQEGWSATAQAYSTKIAHLTRQGGEALLSLLTSNFPPPDPQTAYILDAGAGTGVFTKLLSTAYPNIHIYATDFAPSMLSILQSQTLPNTTTQLLDSSRDHISQGLQPNSFTHAFSTFLIQFLPGEGPKTALKEMTRILIPQTGLLGTAIWTKSCMHEPWDLACSNLDSKYIPPSASNPFGQVMKNIENLEDAYREAGLVDIQSEETELFFECASGEEFADYFIDSAKSHCTPPRGRRWKQAVLDCAGKVQGSRRQRTDTLPTAPEQSPAPG